MKRITVIVDISPATPYDPAVIALCAEQQTELEARYPGTDEAPKGIDPQVEFVVARIDREPVGCAGLKPLEPRVAEVTRMYVRPAHRGQGISRNLLDALEAKAVAKGVRTLRLETGDLQPESIALYQSSGYRRIPAFGSYVGNVLSLCFEKHLKE
ncbi:GNAT family N-acetyltransferase [Thermomonospora umbrina]|uniref:Acetyltransferase (GNAT) family protein n=1 Tax=Thermomonospora umbrina TaxID=111806 RepID=A0A3D9T1N5_9ACTN|nr:GNAT family N-acetyltransferase [Thermomonospora umbrina]REE99155.1 acetyltransferase (GNAT) family protein [Thermomonospora umbrina]